MAQFRVSKHLTCYLPQCFYNCTDKPDCFLDLLLERALQPKRIIQEDGICCSEPRSTRRNVACGLLIVKDFAKVDKVDQRRFLFFFFLPPLEAVPEGATLAC